MGRALGAEIRAAMENVIQDAKSVPENINAFSHLGAYPQGSEIWRLLKPSGAWYHNGVRVTRPR
jgi:hypothetical protein